MSVKLPSKPAEAVKVVVRLRPFNKRETELKCKSCVGMDPKNAVCTLKNLEDASLDKPFKFDAVFDMDSVQSDVFDKTARPIVDSVIEGYNGTVFAYGQTGAGKTFTMEGVPDVPHLVGLISRCFNHVFESVKHSAAEKEFLVRVSIIEIYNEQIRDLLGKDPKMPLELKDSKDRGIYVKGLSSYVVKSIEEIDKVMAVGKKNRAVGATLMNKESSRSHSIITITIETSEKSEVDGEPHIRVGKLNMVDLAGSERADKTGAKGDQLKEGIEINLSLSALGNVISALVDAKSKHVPYRDSKLTRLLQDSLGGNTKTVMVANISPADDNKDETLSTLRYATRAKKIQNKPIVNEDPKDAMLRAFHEEIKRLKQMLEDSSGASTTNIPLAVTDSGESSNGAQPTAATQQQVVTAEPSVSEEQLNEMMKKNEEEKQKIIESMKNQTEEEKKLLLEQQAKLEEEHKKIESELEKHHEQLEQERKEREALAKKLQEMEANVVKGGNQLLEKNKKQEEQIRLHNEEIQRRKNEEERMKREMEEYQEEKSALEEQYKSIEEEAETKTKKLKKLWDKYKLSDAEVKDLQAEFQREREDYLFTIRQLEKEIKLKERIINHYIPEDYLTKIEQNAVWDEETDELTIKNIQHAGASVGRSHGSTHSSLEWARAASKKSARLTEFVFVPTKYTDERVMNGFQ